jgi:hypothetical protein
LQFSCGFFRLVLLFGGYCCKLCPSNSPEVKITRSKTGWTCWPNTTADNSVPEGIRQSLYRYSCSVGSSWVLSKPSLSCSVNCPRMTCTYLSQLIVYYQNTGPTFIAHQTSTFTGWSGTQWVRRGFYELQ